jgi:adenylosuccinate lyase
MITAISPIDGRYASKVKDLGECFSEYALVRNRVKVEVLWLLALCAEPKITECRALTIEEEQYLRAIVTKFTPQEAEKVKEIEKVTNHDVKAVEYYLKDQIAGTSLESLSEFLHFACTSEDINNLSHAMMLKDGLKAVVPLQERIATELTTLANEFKTVPMLARTHGQTASPTTIGKELAVFVARLRKQGENIAAVEILGKLNGAVGNFNAHLSAYPQVDWVALSKKVIEDELGLTQNLFTTQIEPHDYIVISGPISPWPISGRRRSPEKSALRRCRTRSIRLISRTQRVTADWPTPSLVTSLLNCRSHACSAT